MKSEGKMFHSLIGRNYLFAGTRGGNGSDTEVRVLMELTDFFFATLSVSMKTLTDDLIFSILKLNWILHSATFSKDRIQLIF